jgi:glutathione S-transferase
LARLRAALEKGPWIMGDGCSAADLLLHALYAWFPEGMPDDPLIRDRVERCKARPARQKVLAADVTGDIAALPL